eukprot:TRINITY_DN2497_c0_g1_i1.p1 TRINITY_DN2497_c0_g1~~TRINITY_DN2497_c0_g1_i1.p1  ORF type:complete len:245 (+),score=37.21 TRINITY_DN2497_c0_g1_i1:87-821(+)
MATADPAPQVFTNSVPFSLPSDATPVIPATTGTVVSTIFFTFFTFIAIALIWTGTFFIDNDDDDDEFSIGAGLVVVILIFPTVFILLPNLMIILSVRSARSHYGFTVTGIVFSILALIGGLITGIMYALFAAFDDCFAGSCFTNFGMRLVASGSLILFFTQIAVLAIASVETHRVRKMRKTQTQQVIIVQGNNSMPMMPTDYGRQSVLYQAVIQNGQTFMVPVQAQFQAPQFQAQPDSVVIVQS